MNTSHLFSAFVLASVTLMSGCANTASRPVTSHETPVHHTPSSERAASVTYGVIDSIETIRSSNNEIGAGTVIGGIVGGILGHQVGGGTGNDVATMAGAVGGAVIGHQVEKQNRQQDISRIQIRLEHGGYQSVSQGISDLRVGDRVRIEHNQVTRY